MIDITKHYHLVGIGGIGVGAIAMLLAEKGCHVTGSDLRENKMTRMLKDRGVGIAMGHVATNVTNPDFLVVSSAIDQNNAELVEAKSKGIPVMRRAEMLSLLMKDKVAITIAGAHGKTTTTAVLAHLFLESDLSPSFAVGGFMNNDGVNAQWGNGDYFVSEVDESDGSFLEFHPDYSVITNIELEHVDYYLNFENLKKAYTQFIGLTSNEGELIINGDDEVLLDIVQKSGKKFSSFGFCEHNDLIIRNMMVVGVTTEFECFYQGERVGLFHIRVPGKHNVMNVQAAIFLGLKMGIPLENIQKGLKSFQGVGRRFQVLHADEFVSVVDDYAHHPSEIQYTLDTAKSMPFGRVVSVFQPHRYSRFQAFYQQFLEALSFSDKVFITDVYAASEKMIEGKTIQDFVDDFNAKHHCSVAVHVEKNEVVDQVFSAMDKNDLLIFLGAGDVSQMAHECAQRIKESSLRGTHA